MIAVDIHAKSYGSTPVLSRIRFEVADGETVAVLGPSGVGKSTLLRIIAGIDGAYDGSVRRPDNLAVVFQEPTLLPWRSALDNLRLVHPALPRDHLLSMLDRVGLAGKGAQFPGQLSLGQQRRLALARAFSGRPQVLILDEPFVSLDPEMAEDMMDLTQGLIAETRPSTLFVTHARTEAERLADRILTLGGSPATLA